MRETEYNYQYTSAGKNDECYTPREGVEALLPYMQKFKNKIIWLPFDTVKSEYYQVLCNNGFDLRLSSIETGQDFFNYEPSKWDIMISNPPFTNKRAIFERALSFNKPFALLAPVSWLNDSAPVQLFRDKGLQLFIFEKRLKFKNQEQKNKINFKTVYFCRDFLPRDIVFEGEI